MTIPKRPLSSPPPVLSPRLHLNEPSVSSLPLTEPAANILLVDDDPRTLMAMEALLAGPGRIIVSAQSGQEALRRLLRRDFALILLDVRMPDMDGFETAALIRQRERSRYTPIIFLSAVDTLETDVLKGASSGAVDYLFKPVVPDVLKSKVSVFVDLFHMNERLKQKAVQQSEERFRLLVDSVQDYAIFMLDPQGRVTSWNEGAERIMGFQHEEIVGEAFARFYPEEDQAQGLPTQALQQSATEGRHEQEGWRVRKDGSRLWANAVMTALRDERDSLVGFSVVTRDLTERKRVEEALRESENKLRQQAIELEQQLIASGRLVSLGEITASMAHEFNNPLGIIRGFIQDLISEVEPSSSHYRPLQIVEEESRRCEKIIRDLLDYARPRSKSTEFHLTHLNEVIEKTLDMVGSLLYKQKVKVEKEMAADLVPIHADGQELEQVLVNLFLNAIDAMPDGGSLTVGVSLTHSLSLGREGDGKAGTLMVWVTDTGFGIEPNDLPKIFQPFFTAKKKRGMGLGLPICDRIIRNHGGKIEVESLPGQGATFRIYLPLEQKPSQDQPTQREKASSQRSDQQPGG
jgi:PAS domain S-box-containing protein